jgi:amino acid adenylation domain-containing protein
MNELDQQMESLSDDKRKLLEMMLNQESAEFNSFPLSFSQQRLWLLEQIESSSFAYNFPVALRLLGSLNVEVLEQSINEIIRRHEVLRTTFANVNGTPAQVIAESLSLSLAVIGLDNSPRAASEQAVRESEAIELCKQEIRQSFDLSKGPLVRATLFRLSDDHNILLIVLHHIIFDGWSKRILIKELATLYEALSKGEQASKLPELTIQYADYAVWQRQSLQDESSQAQLSYWRQQLDADLPVLDLPTDYPRPAVQSFRGEAQYITVPEGLAEALKALSRREKVTLAMTVLAAFKILLHRYTGSQEIVVGAPIAGRNRTEVENLIGCFLNTLVLRTSLSGEPSFRELLQRVREMMLGAYSNQDLPLEILLQELQTRREASRTPMFQVFFNMLNLPDDRFDLPCLTIESFLIDEVESKFDLTLYVKEQSNQIQLISVYNADLFEKARVSELLDQLKRLLEQIVDAPEKKIAQYSLITEAAKSILPDPAQRQADRFAAAAHTAFGLQAEAAGERVAIADSTDRWTYRELEARSNQIANCLLGAGVDRGEIVAVYAHRSASLIWAILGVLRAGAAFLILDPAHPAKRLIRQIEAARPAAWIHIERAGELQGELKEFVEARQWKCNMNLPGRAEAEEKALLSEFSQQAPAIEVTPDDLAYIIFTSGTTGAPKGIATPHGPLAHFAQWQAERFGLDESDRFSMLSGLGHDPLLRDIFAPLSIGATVCVPDAEEITTPGRLAEWMREAYISVAHMTPAINNLLTDSAATLNQSELNQSERAINNLRYAFFGGDLLTEHEAAMLKRFAPSVTCINFYGATETPQAMSYFILSDKQEAKPGRRGVPLGKGIEGAQLLVLNKTQALAGVGELGEIHIRTPYLAKGYLGDEELTRERFIKNPFTEMASDRLYKTGDLGRYRADGNVVFAGRSDHQLKIRGHRIEIGEVEAALLQTPKVAAAVVAAYDHAAGEKRLAAYVVAKDAQAITSRELRRHLNQTLPEYMLPSDFVILDAMPLTPNGKVDRRALPAPDGRKPEDETAFVAPEMPIQHELARIWADLLHLERVGIRDNFFESGGHSLLAMQMLARVQAKFAVKISVPALFKHPTVEGLAELVETAIVERSDSARVDQVLDMLESFADSDALSDLLETIET